MDKTVKTLSIGELHEVKEDEVLDVTKYNNYDMRINSKGRKEVFYDNKFISKYHPKLIIMDSAISAVVAGFLTLMVLASNVSMGITMTHWVVFITLFLTFMYVTRGGYGKKAGKKYHGHIGKNKLEDGGDKKLVERFKDVYLMEDKSIKFGYELVNLDKSTSKDLVLEIYPGSQTLSEVRRTGDVALLKAIKDYVDINMLEDTEILSVLKTYYTLKKYDEDKAKQEHFLKFLDNKEQLDSVPKLNNKMDSGKQLLIEDMEELRLKKVGSQEENKQIINKIREKAY